MSAVNRYARIIERIFLSKFTRGAAEVPFDRDDIVHAARRLRVKLPKNLGDVVYSFRYRTELPESVRSKAPAGKEWIIRPRGTSRYCFVGCTR